MSLSSHGFHTLMLSSPLFEREQLMEHFTEFSKKTGSIQIYTDDYGATVITFHKEHVGIKWCIRRDIWIEEYKGTVDFLYVEINPKILSGITDYLTAATLDDMDVAITNFNRISQSISPILGSFDDYKLTRIDYCVNLSLKELAPECTDEQMIDLIKRSDVPPSYIEWTEYDKVAHRTKTKPESFYLMNNSIHINCYSKYMQLVKRSEENIAKGYPPIPQETLLKARGIIRFEVQCHYRKTYSLSRRAQKNGDQNYNKYEHLLTHEHCVDVLNHYYKKTIGRGHWYPLHTAIAMVKKQNYNLQKEARLIVALEEVSQYRSVAKAKEAYQGHDLDIFKQSLKDLRGIGINPVTIPKHWGIKRILNLLETYHSRLWMEQFSPHSEDILVR